MAGVVGAVWSVEETRACVLVSLACQHVKQQHSRASEGSLQRAYCSGWLQTARSFLRTHKVLSIEAIMRQGTEAFCGMLVFRHAAGQWYLSRPWVVPCGAIILHTRRRCHHTRCCRTCSHRTCSQCWACMMIMVSIEPATEPSHDNGPLHQHHGRGAIEFRSCGH